VTNFHVLNPNYGRSNAMADVARPLNGPEFGDTDRAALLDSLAGRNPEAAIGTGPLVVRLARDAAEVRAAQALRYAVFYQEMDARPTAAVAAAKRDFDAFDNVADLLLVVDRSKDGTVADGTIVGTYRLLRHQVAMRHGGFYSAREYDLAPLLDGPPARQGLLELGRSCVARDYRTNATIHLLWRGITAYLAAHRLAVLFGCASLPGREPEALALPLAYLHHFHRAPPELRARAVADRAVEMNRMPAEAINPKRAWVQLPPLVKAYLRLGGVVGDGAVVDHQFGTTDIFMVVSLARVAERYFSHFDRKGRIAPARP